MRRKKMEEWTSCLARYNKMLTTVSELSPRGWVLIHMGG